MVSNIYLTFRPWAKICSIAFLLHYLSISFHTLHIYTSLAVLHTPRTMNIKCLGSTYPVLMLRLLIPKLITSFSALYECTCHPRCFLILFVSYRDIHTSFLWSVKISWLHPILLETTKRPPHNRHLSTHLFLYHQTSKSIRLKRISYLTWLYLFQNMCRTSPNYDHYQVSNYITSKVSTTVKACTICCYIFFLIFLT